MFGHVLHTAVVSDEFQCHLKCLGFSKCMSFNVHLAESGSSGRICQLNNETRETKPIDFKQKKGSRYYGPVKVGRSYCFILMQRTVEDCKLLVFIKSFNAFRRSLSHEIFIVLDFLC